MKTKKLYSLLMLVISLMLVSCGQSGPDPKLEKNKEALKKVIDAFNTGNTDNLDQVVDANFIEHTPDPMIKATGFAGLMETIKSYRTSYPDLKMTLYSITADGDLVYTHFNMKGTNTGPMGDMPATGKAFDIDGVDIVKFANGKGTEHWGYFDQMKFMTQLGMMQDPAAPADSSQMK